MTATIAVVVIAFILGFAMAKAHTRRTQIRGVKRKTIAERITGGWLG